MDEGYDEWLEKNGLTVVNAEHAAQGAMNKTQREAEIVREQQEVLNAQNYQQSLNLSEQQHQQDLELAKLQHQQQMEEMSCRACLSNLATCQATFEQNKADFEAFNLIAKSVELQRNISIGVNLVFFLVIIVILVKRNKNRIKLNTKVVNKK